MRRIVFVLAAIVFGLNACPLTGQPAIAAEDKDACRNPTPVTVSSVVSLSIHASYAEARSEAVRRALAEATTRVGGAEIASSFQSTVSETQANVNTDAQQKTVVRSKGRVHSWKIESEEPLNDGADRQIKVVVRAFVCASDQTKLVNIVAFAPFADFGRVGGERYRELMGALFPRSQQYSATLNASKQAYYDILVSGQILEIDESIRDQTGEIAILGRFFSPDEVSQLPGAVRRVSVRVAVRAERLSGEPELFEVSTQTQHLAPDTDTLPVIKYLLEAAVTESSKALYSRLMVGD